MKRLVTLLGAASMVALATPAVAQHSGHMPGMVMPPEKKPEAKKPALKKPVAKKPAAKSKPAPKPAKKAPAAKPAPAVADPHAGHDMATMPATAPSGTDLPAGDAPAPPVPTDHAADVVFGPEAMAMPRHHLDEHGGQKFAKIMFNLAEYQVRKGEDGYEWDAQAWYGGDIGKLWLKSEGEGTVGGPLEQAELQALYSHAIGPYFNLQGGVRYDIRPNPSRAYAVLAVEGLAPYWFEVEGSLFLSNKGELMARAEGYYDQRITQRLTLQPRVELNFAAQSSREIGVGSGLSEAELGLRLRYAIAREFAPYVGVKFTWAFGDTAKYLREEGEDPSVWSFVTGVRVWF